MLEGVMSKHHFCVVIIIYVFAMSAIDMLRYHSYVGQASAHEPQGEMVSPVPEGRGGFIEPGSLLLALAYAVPC